MNPFELTPECREAAHRYASGLPDPDRARSIRVFKSDFVEKVLGRAHPITPIIWFGPVMAYGIWRGISDGHGALGTLGLFAAGWLAWTLMEYLLHRFLFHWKGTGPSGEMRAFLMHGYHHEYPDDGMRLVAPPMMSWGPAALVALAWWAILGARLWAPVFAGTVAGYVAYDWIHYYTHHARPRFALGKWLRRYHMLHHHKSENAYYGVSSPLWDLVFGTWRSRG
jgi:sterol desaturase/sphingolipid hydroxylase (fatty acid hydroxylase superfamily)